MHKSKGEKPLIVVEACASVPQLAPSLSKVSASSSNDPTSITHIYIYVYIYIYIYIYLYIYTSIT